MAQTILKDKQSTSGSPYVIYTVNVTPSNRTLTTVDLSVQITAHLKNADSSLGTGSGYGIKGKLIVAGQTKWFDGASGNGPIIKGTNSSWSGTGNHTTSAYNYTITGLSWDTTSLSASFYAIRTSGNTSNAGYLKTTDCTAITIEKAAAPSTITDIVGGGGTTDYTPYVKWTPKDSSFKFKLIYSYGSWANYNINNAPFIYPNTTSEHTYSSYKILGSEVAPYMSIATVDFTATLYTYDSSGNQIGSANSKTFKVTLNTDTYKPTASIDTFSEAGGIVPSSWGIFVAGKSKLSFTVSGSRSDTGASTTLSYSTSVNGKTYTTTSITTDWISSSGNASLTVTDSRGRTGTASRGYTVVNYITPDINLTGYRVNNEGAAKDDGTYYHYSISGHIQSCKNGNTEKNNVSEIKIGYKIAGSSSDFSYTPISVNIDSTVDNRVAFSGSGKVFGNLSGSNNYEIRVYLKDGLNSEGYDIETVTAAFKLIDYKADGTGIAIGKKATDSHKFVVNLTNGTETNILTVTNCSNNIYDNGSNVQALPEGADDRDYWNNLKNGFYWYGNTGAVPNMPSGWGFVEKRGFMGTSDFTVLYYTQNQGPIYRKSGNSATVTGWVKLDAGNADYATSAGSATRATQDSDGVQINSGYFRRHSWWNSGSALNVNDLHGGTTFVYTTHAAPTNGTLASFDCSDNNAYTLQIMSDYYYGNNFYFRTRNGDGNYWNSWKQLQTIPVSLYESSGTTSSFTLSESAANFSYIIIMYSNTSDTYHGDGSQTLYAPNGRTVNLVSNYDNGSFLYICNAYYTINGTSVTKNREIRWRLTPSSSSAQNTRTDNTANIKIYKVIGIR